MKAWGNLNNWVIVRGKLMKSLVLVVSAFVPVIAFASPPPSSAAQEFGAILDRLINFSLGLLVILAVAVIIYISFMFLFAGGDVEKVKKARLWLFYITIAIAVGLLSKVIVAVVYQVTTGSAIDF
jgi:hypothetical protein